jgi:hypothetical protein
MRDEARPYVVLDAARLLRALDAGLAAERRDALRAEVAELRAEVADAAVITAPALPTVGEDEVAFRRDVLLADLAQILEARTLQRARYYVTRLRRAATEVRTGKINDIDLNRWKAYDHIHTDSLWLIDRRDTSGAHQAWYWGNFIPQIPHQMMLRYTKAGEWVLDPFAGSGTTLLECLRLGRHGLGVELNPEVVTRTEALLAEAANPHDVRVDLVQGDSTALDFEALLAARGVGRAHLLVLHPPYHDIIPFSDDARDLSNAESVDAFVARFVEVVARTAPLLARGRYMAIVIGDKYVQGEWIPLGFYVMQAVMDMGYTLKSIVVKNFDRTRAKRDQAALWRYRALVGGFYVFKHEYILVFQT